MVAHPRFSARNRFGDELALRHPEPGELLCGPCADTLLVEGTTPVIAGHSCQDVFTTPVWLLRSAGCELNGFAEHVLTGADCRCGTADLYTALDGLDADERQQAVAAHVAVLRDGYSHLLAAQACDDGIGLAAHLPAACLLCITDPEHVDTLDTDIAHASAQLALVIRAFETTIHIGDRRG